MLRKIGNKLEQLEEEIFVGRGEEIVRDISNVKQEIINFRKIIRPQRPVLRDLERTKQRYMREELEVYFDDIVDASERIWDMLENYKEVVEALEDTNESVISHRVNDILRVLTSFSVIVLPLTFIASLWGMNVGVPGEGDKTAFWIIAGVMVRCWSAWWRSSAGAGGYEVAMSAVAPGVIEAPVSRCGASSATPAPSRVVSQVRGGERRALRGGRQYAQVTSRAATPSKPTS